MPPALVTTANGTTARQAGASKAPPSQLWGHDMDRRVAAYAVVFAERPTGLGVTDAARRCGVRGAVVRSLKGYARSTGVIAVGDLLYRVNDVDVLDVAHADVIDVLRDASTSRTPCTLQFVPKRMLADVQRIVAQRDTAIQARILDQIDRYDGNAMQLVMENQYGVLHTGYAYMQNRSMPGSAKVQPWEQCHVVLRVSSIECLENARSIATGSGLGFVGRRCEVRALSSASNDGANTTHTLELRVDDDVWALRFGSETDQVAWLDALSLACDASQVLGRDADDAMVPPLDMNQVALLHRLLEQERLSTLCGRSCNAMKRRIEAIDERMEAIGSPEATHPDSVIQRSLRSEYARLQHDKQALRAQIHATESIETRTDCEWEEANAAATPSRELMPAAAMAGILGITAHRQQFTSLPHKQDTGTRTKTSDMMGDDGDSKQPQGQHQDDETNWPVVTYVAVEQEGLQMADAFSPCGFHGAVVLRADMIAVGDILCRVNHVEVLGMAYADVVDVLRDASTPRTLELAPHQLLADVQRVVAQREAAMQARVVDQLDEYDGNTVQLLTEHQYAVLRSGYAYVQDRSLVGCAAKRPWRRLRVVLRVSSIECYAINGVRVVALSSELGFVGRRCDVRALPGKPDETVSANQALELRVGEDDVWALAFASPADHVTWLRALALAVDASKTLDRVATEQDMVSPLDTSQAALLLGLLEQERHASLRGLSCCEMERRARYIEFRVRAISRSLKAPHLDNVIERSLQDEAVRLQHDKQVLTARIAAMEPEETRKDREWDDANAAANLDALRAIRRCMPVNVRTLSEDALRTMATPSGKLMPAEIAHKFKRASVLELLRLEPRYNPIKSELELEALTLTERRALLAHFREASETWRADAAKGRGYESKQRSWEIFSDLKRTFKRVLDAYDRHVAQFGPPGDHAYADGDDVSSVGCPLRGKQCPLNADRAPAYDIDLGFPDGDVFGRPDVDSRYHYQLEGIVDSDLASVDGFRVAAAAETYGAHSIWANPQLLRLDLDANELELSHRVFLSSEPSDNLVATEVYKGTYAGTAVAVKRLVNDSKTLSNAAALAERCKWLGPGIGHPNLVPLIGLVWSKAVDLQVVTPWIECGDLRSFLDTSDAASLTWEGFKCQVAIDVASAITHLHERTICAGFGAITARNVLLDGDNGTAWLNVVQLPCLDLATARDRVPTPMRWFAPEVVLGRQWTQRSDIYSLGVLLTELDTTKLPFHDAVNPNGAPMEDMLIAFRVARRILRPSLSLECPEAIAALVDQCLAQDPEERPSATSVVYKLREILKNEL